MDISAFSDDNFDTKAWINDLLKNSDHPNKKENYTMSLVMKLQLYVQQVNNSLEETSQSVLQSLPKIMRDSKSLQEEAIILKEKMAIVKQEIIKIEQETGKSINSIEKLDSIKNKLHVARQGLHESDNWTVLVNDLEEVFDSKNIEAISSKIFSMQNSLKLLVNVADYEDRKSQLEGLKNRMEAIASPSIVQAFTGNKTEQSIMFVKIFSSIERLPQLVKYYQNCQKDVLLKKWRNLLENEQDETTVQWIYNFNNFLLSNWHSQIKWFNNVFGKENAIETLMDVYTDALRNLDPSIVECANAALKQVPDKLNFLLEMKQTLQQFANSLIDLINQQSNGSNLEKKKVLLLQAIYSPMTTYVNKYAAFEQAKLIKELNALNIMKEELPDTIKSLGMNISSVFDLARESKNRCSQLTENTGICGLIIAYRAFLIAFADLYRVALRQIDRSKKHEEDWNTFQMCLSLLQNVGDVLLNLQQLEKSLTDDILDFNGTKYSNLFLTEDDKKEFDSLVKCVTEGTKLSLLDQVSSEFARLCYDIHHTTYHVVFAPISKHLDIVQKNKTWEQFAEANLHGSDLPDYSFSPLEYITEIGQYLLTLPQHLEPFLFNENPSLTCALKAVDQEYNNATDAEGAMADVFLRIVARGTCQGYCDRILSINKLSQSASRQLAQDINYLDNVLKDLGIQLSDSLQQIALLLKIPSDQYQAQSSNCTARYVSAVRQMRNITLN